jgi:hypothetical protein
MPNWTDDEGRCRYTVDGVPCYESGVGCALHHSGKNPKKRRKDASVEAAFKRGVEAMRKAAMGAAWHSAAMGLYKRIQEMPVPEDKQ